MKKILLLALVITCVLPFFSYEAVADDYGELKKIIREICGADKCEVMNLLLFIKNGEVIAIAPPDAGKERYTVQLLDNLAEGQKRGEKFYDFTSLGISKNSPSCLYWKEIALNNKTIKICLVPGP